MSCGMRVRLGLFLTVMAWLVVIPAAHAYIDPGSTSMIFSALVAGLAAVGTAATMFWHRLRGLFRRTRPADVAAKAEPEGHEKSG